MANELSLSSPQSDTDWFKPGRPLPPEPEHDCILLGPAGAGKSGLLSALSRACDGNPRGNVGLSLIPGSSLAGLTGETARLLGGDSPALAPTGEPATYDLQLRIRDHVHKSEEPRTIHMIFQDLPGGDLFDSSKFSPVRYRLQRARTASCLVLCVHSLQPDRMLWESRLPTILDALLEGSGRLAPRLSRIGHGELPPMFSPERQLPFERILVILTQIDRLCATAARAVTTGARAGVGTAPPAIKALMQDNAKFALHLDPLQMVKDRLGEGLLAQIRSACSSGTRLALGLTSAWGFAPLISGQEGSPRSRRLEHWRPFGLWESMMFLATGEARHPVELLPLETGSPAYSHAYSSVKCSK